MIMRGVPHLDELDTPVEPVHHLLVAARLPPFNGAVVFAAGGNEPDGKVGARKVLDLGRASLLPAREVDIALKGSWFDAGAQVLIEEIQETVNRVAGGGVAFVDEWQDAIHHLHAGVV